MPALMIHLRWPDGHTSQVYSPSTCIHGHFQAGSRYAIADFLQRAESGFHAAAERLKQVRGFYCSSALDSLGSVRRQAAAFRDTDQEVEILSIQPVAAAGGPSTYGDL